MIFIALAYKKRHVNDTPLYQRMIIFSSLLLQSVSLSIARFCCLALGESQ